MFNLHTGRYLTIIFFLALRLAPAAAETAWPTYRLNSARTGWSDAQLGEAPAVSWRVALPKPQPAWPAPAYGNLLTNVSGLSKWDISDHAYHVVGTQGRVYFGSSTDDGVHCLRLADGKPHWQFFTGAPVRMPPTVVGDRVYAGSDDGLVYCLNADTGEVVWQRRIGPEDRWLPGSGRLISRWPVRGGPLVQGDTVWVTAGVFPLEGVFMAALDRHTGEVKWRHAIDTVAHGPMVASAEQLFVPALRANPNVFELATGKHLGGVGGSGAFATFARQKLITGPNETGALAGVDNEVQQALGVRQGFQLITQPNRLVAASNKALAAFDDKLQMQWKVERTATHSLVGAGDTIIAGGEGEVTGYDAKLGKVLWRFAIDGNALGLSVVNQALVVSTDRGELVGLSGTGLIQLVGAKPTATESAPTIEPQKWQDTANYVRQAARTQHGYALVLGMGDQTLSAAVAIAEATQLHTVALLPADKLVKARESLAQVNQQGTQVSLFPQEAGTAAFADYIFNVVFLRLDSDSTVKHAAELEKIQPLLQPDNGVVVTLTEGTANPLATHPANPLSGAGQWSHPFADAGNTSCSQDELVKSPFEMQWFGPPGPEYMVDRHNRTSPPLFKNGRLIVPGFDQIVAVDGYNGTVLWQRDLPGSTRLSVSKNCGHVVAGPDNVFVATHEKCLALSAETGETITEYAVPEANAADYEWGYLALVDRVILGSASPHEPLRRTLASNSWERGYLDFTPMVTSDRLFAYDQSNGKLLWQQSLADTVAINSTLAADASHLYCVEAARPGDDKLVAGRARLPDLFAKPGYLVARDLKTGAVAWRQELKITPQHSLFLVVAGERALLAHSRNEGNTLLCEIDAFSTENGQLLWHVAEPTGLPIGGSHGEQEQHPLVVQNTVYFRTFACDVRTGKVSRDWKLPLGGCGALSASLHTTFFRASTSSYADLDTPGGNTLTGVTRPGCWLNMLPAGGLLLAPESSAGCTCQYPIQTSLAMKPLAADPPKSFYTPVADQPPVEVGDLEFVGRVRLELKPADADSVVRYTFDSVWPTADSPAYEQPLVVDRSSTLWARSYRDGRRGGYIRRKLMEVVTPRPVAPSTDFVTSARIEFAKLPGEAVIRYRTDGQTPTVDSPLYTQPFDVAENIILVAAYFLDGQAIGPPATVEFRKVPGRPSVQPGETVQGLRYEYVEGDNWTKLPNFDELTPLRRGDIPRFVIPEHRPDGYAVRYTGFIEVPVDGMYTFFLRSDDGSELRIGGDVIVSNDGIHDARGERRGQVPLAAGKHAIDVRYFDVAAGELLTVSVQAPGSGKREIPTEFLWRPSTEKERRE